MNELMITLLENNWFLYAACGSVGVGCLIQIVLSVIYNRSLNESERMRNTRTTWLRQMKARYESGYEWNNRIRNVELFVDKNIGRRKWMGVYLRTWEELGKMMLPLVLVFSALGAVCAGTYMEEKTIPLLYLATGAVLAVLLRGMTALANLKEKQRLLRTNLCDYFENTLQGEAKNRRKESLREREEFFEKQTLREELACAAEDMDNAMRSGQAVGKDSEKEAVGFSTERAALLDDNGTANLGEKKVCNKSDRMSDGMIEKHQQESKEVGEAKSQRKHETSEIGTQKDCTFESRKQRKEAAKIAKVAAKSNKKALRQEKKQAKQSAKLAKKEVKLMQKQEKKAAKEAAKLQRKHEKEQKRVDKLTKRMKKMQLQLGTAATVESAGLQNSIGGKKEESARLKREQLKRKVDATPAQEDQIISEVLREFLA